MSESSRIPSKDEIMFSLFLPPKRVSAVRMYGDEARFDASASFLSLPDSGRLKKRRPKKSKAAAPPDIYAGGAAGIISARTAVAFGECRTGFFLLS